MSSSEDEEEVEQEDVSEEDDTNAKCGHCALRFYSASGNPLCVTCRAKPSTCGGGARSGAGGVAAESFVEQCLSAKGRMSRATGERLATLLSAVQSDAAHGDAAALIVVAELVELPGGVEEATLRAAGVKVATVRACGQRLQAALRLWQSQSATASGSPDSARKRRRAALPGNDDEEEEEEDDEDEENGLGVERSSSSSSSSRSSAGGAVAMAMAMASSVFGVSWE